MMNYREFLNLNKEEVKQKALERRENMIIQTEIREEIEGLNGGRIEVKAALGCQEALVVLPYVEKINEINPKVVYDIKVNEEVGSVPVFTFYNESGEEVGVLTQYPEQFKRRIKGLDEEDTKELIERYRRGYYNNEVIKGLIKFLK